MFCYILPKLELTVRNRRVDFHQSNRCRVSRSRCP